ncbi:MAG: hypothetical protein KQH59_06475 [Desulfobulbaceae bacterium]|nr:hypothetical protein [Desulfobulbaceae bacterium]
MMSENVREDIRENVFSLKLMQHIFFKSQSLSSDILRYSLENKLYQRIISSFAWKADVPFVICIEQLYPTTQIINNQSKKSKNKVYLSPDNKDFQRAKKVLKIAEKSEYTEQLGSEIFDAAMEEIAQRITTMGSKLVNTVLESDLNLRIWNVTNSVRDEFSELVHKSWSESGKQLIEIAVTIDTQSHLDTSGEIVRLCDLPYDIVESYREGFAEFHKINSDLLEKTSLAIDEVKKLKVEFPLDFLEPYISESVTHLEDQQRVVTEFDTRIRTESDKNIGVYDSSLDGFLNYPLPPM